MPLNAQAIRACVREVLEGTIAGVRAIPEGTLSCDIAPGATDDTLSERAMVRPLALVTYAWPQSPDRPMGPGPLRFTGVEATVTLTALLATQSLGASDYEAPKRNLEAVAQGITDAFEWPGKLATTSAAVATGIVSGVLTPTDGGWTVVRDDAPQSGQATGGGLYQLQCTFAGTVVTTGAVS